ncbi:MAG TPA: hypothetical protein VJ981_03245, partial [Gammaproteobacteria bacterium]|nr:hypothetical protein [Gammaproteobacteria bacterium]
KNDQQDAAQIAEENRAVPETAGQPRDTVEEPAVVTEPEMPEPTREEIIKDLLEKADQNISTLSLTTPRGDNALEKYRQVLEMEPGNREALAGIDRIVDEYVGLMDNAIETESLGRAQEYLRKANAVNSSHPALPAARERLASALKASRESSSSPTVQLPATEAGTGVPGKSDTAARIPAGEQRQIDSIRERLRANPNDRQARRDLRELANTFEQNIRQAVNEGDYDLARAYIYEVQDNTEKSSRAYKRLGDLLKNINEREKATR